MQLVSLLAKTCSKPEIKTLEMTSDITATLLKFEEQFF